MMDDDLENAGNCFCETSKGGDVISCSVPCVSVGAILCVWVVGRNV